VIRLREDPIHRGDCLWHIHRHWQEGTEMLDGVPGPWGACEDYFHFGTTPAGAKEERQTVRLAAAKADQRYQKLDRSRLAKSIPGVVGIVEPTYVVASTRQSVGEWVQRRQVFVNYHHSSRHGPP
jgi:hypothetical protein